MTELSDSELMRRYAEGSSEAFAELFQRYERRAYGYFLRRTGGSVERAADLYQELFLRLHRFRDRFDPDRPFAPWFFQIAHHVLTDELRRQRRSREVALEHDPSSALEPDPEQQVDARLRAEQVLDSVSREEAQLLLAAKVEGFEYSEVARRLGRSVDAVKQSASRTLRRLRAAQAYSTVST